MQGEYIVDRLMPGFVSSACSTLGYECRLYSDEWVIRIDGNSTRRWVIGYTFDINSAGAVGVASDKVASSLMLSDEGVPVVCHYLVRSHAEQDLLVGNLSGMNPDLPVVIKPLSGSGGRSVKLLPDQVSALEYIRTSTHPDWALSPFHDIASEKRAVMLDGKILCAYDKTQPNELDGLRMFNLGQGAVAVNCELSWEENVLAERALKASGLRVASVDIATLRDGEPIIMEINSGITMEHYARQSDEYFNIARDVYAQIVQAMMRSG